MKKLFGIIAVSAFLFAACGNNGEQTDATDSTATDTAAVVETPAQEQAPVAADTTAVEDTTQKAA